MTYKGFLITISRGMYRAERQGQVLLAETKDELFEMLDNTEEK